MHASLFKKALANPAELPSTDYYFRQMCGYTHEGPAEKCPICGADANMFKKVED